VALAVIRVWLDDRPGSLASVAGRIGQRGGDLVGIDVLERGAGRVIDEFVVELPGDWALEQLVDSVNDLEGVDVEFAEIVPEFPDPRLDALELAGALVSAPTADGLVKTLVDECRQRFGCSWVAVVDRSTASQVEASGQAPYAGWLAAFVTGISESGGEGPMDVAWAALAGTDLFVVLGRDQTRFRERERRQISALAGIAATRYLQSARPRHDDRATEAHPSWGDRKP
jgi:hypothetical protein